MPRVMLSWAWLLLCVGPAVAQDASPPAGVSAEKSLVDLPLSMESRPYRVRIVVAADPSESAALQQKLSLALERSIGSLWQVDLAELDGVSRHDREVLSRWSASDVQARFQEEGIDFWLAVTVQDRGSQRLIAVRAWQPRFEWLSPVHESAFYEPRETAGRIVKLCWGLFRPEILIERVDGNTARMRIPGGDLQPADPAYALFQAGDVLTPWMMYYDRNRVVQRRQEFPWTYVRLDKIDGALATGTVLSGLRSPLAGKTRGRMEKVAVATRAVYPETKLQIGVQNQPARRLAGYRLEVRPKLPERQPEAKPKAEADETAEEDDVQQLLTDRLGETKLIPNAADKLMWIFVYSGELLLARVPFVPGSLPFARLDVPDDSIRLQVEGDLQVLQNQLINLVAERNTLIAAAKASSKKGDWQRVVGLRKELDGLPDKQAYVERLAGIRVPAVNAAKARKDRSAQARIEKLCKDVSELIDRYLDAEKLQMAKDDLDQLQKDAKFNDENAK